MMTIVMRSQPSPPTGDVTFVFTDIEGSTALWDRTPDAMTESLAEHDRRIISIVDRHEGYVFTTAGDSFAVAFHSAVQAVEAALDIQFAFLEPAAGLTFKVRVGAHSGMATIRNGDYFGAAVNRGARLWRAPRRPARALAGHRRPPRRGPAGRRRTPRPRPPSAA